MRYLLFLFLGFPTLIFAQSENIERDDLYIGAGAGFGSTLAAGKINNPSWNMSFDYNLSEQVGIGLSLGYITSTDNLNVNDIKIDYTYLVTSLRGLYHYQLISNEDFKTYVGLVVGYNYADYTTDATAKIIFRHQQSGLYYNGLLGLRYSISNLVGVYAEVGFGAAYLTTGVYLKL